MGLQVVFGDLSTLAAVPLLPCGTCHIRFDQQAGNQVPSERVKEPHLVLFLPNRYTKGGYTPVR
jgi:hypothetical protein